ncbi:MAG TPA: adenylate/guanylate cyclase domain-containing protein [Gammaproteobacteria bacterium]|nr:adenylate/guanylate cyclase domain-containing protein [Gammaproteobacteria bacterium]
MSRESSVAVLFADVVGSTELYELLGDFKARETVGQCIEVMRRATETHNGRVVKTIGDEVMATFPTADGAMNAARDMQVAISKGEVVSGGGAPLAIRVGCDFGPVIPEQRDVFGSTVNTANRVTSQAKAAQVLITDNMVANLGGDWRAAVRQIDLAPLKGKSGEVAMYEALWQSEDITSMLPTITWGDQKKKARGRMRIRYLGKEVMVDSTRPHATLGRSDENDLVIKGNLISRLHARIEMNRDRFLLIDQSTNGSFVVTRKGEELFVRRDSVPISGEGVIGLGRIVQPGSDQAITFIQED